MEVAEKIGKLTSAIIKKKTTDVVMATRGTLLSPANNLMAAAFSCGLAKDRDTSANLINSKSILTNADIVVRSRTRS